MSSETPLTTKLCLKLPSAPKPKSASKKSKPKAKLTLTKAKPKAGIKLKPGGGPGGGAGGPKGKPKGKGKGPASKGPPQAAAGPTFKKKDDGAVDLEQQFILRLPPGPAMALRHDVEAGSQNLKDKLSIELSADYRHSFVRYGGQLYNARLVDLPCILETLKTTDRKTFYKTADICQMLICKDSDFSSEEDEDSPKKPKDKDKDNRYRWNHGITPPLKNVRKRRFRKTMKKKQYQDQPDIEKEVKRLFRMDNEAIDVKWEVVIEDPEDGQTPGEEHTEKNVVLAHGDVFNPLNSSEAKKVENQAASENISKFLESDIFGDVSSSEEEDLEMGGDHEINIMDSGEEEATPSKSGMGDDSLMDNNDSMMSSMRNEDDSNTSFNMSQQVAAAAVAAGVTPQQPTEPKPQLPQFSAKTEMFESFMSTDPTAQTMSEDEIRERMSELSQHMQDLRDRRAQQEMELVMMDASSLKDRLERELNNMIEEENEKQKEYDSLAAMLGIPT